MGKTHDSLSAVLLPRYTCYAATNPRRMINLEVCSSLAQEIKLMMPPVVSHEAPVPPPAYHRAQARLGPALHIDALTLVRTLHLLTLCRLAVRLAHRRCPPPLPSGPGGAPRPTGKSRYCSSRSYGHFGSSPIRTCAIGYVPGLPWPWRAACLWAKMAVRAFLAHLGHLQTWATGRSPTPRGALCPQRPRRYPFSADWGAGSDHR